MSFSSRNTIALIVLITGLGSLPSHGQPTRYEIKDAGLRNVAWLTAETLLEALVATNFFVSGWIESDASKTIQGEVILDLRTFETGEPSHNQKLREWLGAFTQPFVTLKILRWVGTPAIQKSAKAKGAATGKPEKISLTGKLEGTLKIQDVERPFTAPAELHLLTSSKNTRRRLPGNLASLRTEFSVDLTKFGLVAPPAVAGLWNALQRWRLHLVGTDTIPTIPN